MLVTGRVSRQRSFEDSQKNASQWLTAKKKMRRRVAVTGLGVVSPLATGSIETWKQLLAGQSAVRRLTPADFEDVRCGFFYLTLSHIRCHPSSLIPSSPNPPRTQPSALATLPVRVAATVDDSALISSPWAPLPDAASYRGPGLPPSHTRASLFALAAAAEAAAQAGWVGCGPLPYARHRVLVSMGVGMPSVREAVAAGRDPSSNPSFLSPRCLGATPAVAVAAWLGSTGGPLMAPSTACAAGASAIADAAAAVAAGVVDAAIAGGAEAAVEPLTIAGFARMRALAAGGGDGDGAADPTTLSRPFDAGRAGFVLGEGAAVLVLEAADAAAARGAIPLAFLAGSGASCDAHHPAQPPPDGSGAAAAMRAALADAGLDPAAIAHVSAHATSTPAGDAAEAAALRAVFGGGGGRPNTTPPAVSSIKGAVGHLLGAAGALEAAMAVEALAAGTAPPTLNLEHPDVGGTEPAFLLVGPAAGGVGLVSGGGRPLAALSNSFGFGGVNVCLALSR